MIRTIVAVDIATINLNEVEVKTYSSADVVEHVINAIWDNDLNQYHITLDREGYSLILLDWDNNTDKRVRTYLS